MGLDDIIGTVVGNFPSPAINYGLNLYQQHQARGEAREIREADAELQREFAKNSIKWKVQDAIDAGIHPLAALGASGYSASPSSVGVPPYDYTTPLREMGQNVSRAAMATQTQDDRVLNELRIARELAEIELIKAQTTNIGRPTNPGMPGNYPPGGPLEGQGDVYRTPQRKVEPHRSHVYSEPGTITDVGWADTPTGLAPVPSADVKERIEDQIIQEVGWSIRNQLQPTLSFGHMGARPPWDQMKKRWPDATGYYYHPFKQEWQPAYGKRRK